LKNCYYSNIIATLSVQVSRANNIFGKMDAPPDTSPVKTKTPVRHCPRCPHRLSDLWTHESPPESPESAQATSGIPEMDTPHKYDDDEEDSNSTLVEDQVDEEHTLHLPPDYPGTASEQSHLPAYSGDEHQEDDSSVYHELGSDDGHWSSDEHNDEDYHSAREYHSDEEYLLDKYKNEEGQEDDAKQEKSSLCSLSPASSNDEPRRPPAAQATASVKPDHEVYSKDKSLPDSYTCCECGKPLGSPIRNETIIDWEGVREDISEDGRTILYKLCDRCGDIQWLEWELEHNPRLYERSAEREAQMKNEDCDPRQFEEWKEFVDKALPSPQGEVVSEEALVASGLETVVEEAEES
jgi:hypothetical protein